MALFTASFMLFLVFEQEKAIEPLTLNNKPAKIPSLPSDAISGKPAEPYWGIGEDVTDKGVKSEKDGWGVYTYEERGFKLQYPLGGEIKANLLTITKPISF